MDNPKKNRLATAVVDRLCSFQKALGGTTRKYPTREFLSFAAAARSYINLTRHALPFLVPHGMPSALSCRFADFSSK